MKKSVLFGLLSVAFVFTSCKSKESAYKQAYEAAKAQETTQVQVNAPVAVTPKKLNIVEGTYSHHPYFGNPYDLKILLTVDEETQRKRILERPAFLHKRFFEEWIPMENRYFEAL